MENQKKAPRNIAPWDLLRYRLPWAGKASILHRISGALLFLALPALLMALESSLRPIEVATAEPSIFSHGLAKSAALVLIWAYLHHFLAGLRYLALDLHMGIDKVPANRTAQAVSLGAVVLTAALGGRLFGLY
jgi:succinate dehydrogenase / fumarate reductase cytochrome b subunit